MKRGLCCLCAVLLCTALVTSADDPTALNAGAAQLDMQTPPANSTGNSAATVGTRITTVCPTDAIFSQPAQDAGTAGNSDADGGYKIYDNYSTYSPIEDIHFWSIAAFYSGGWFECTPNPAGESFLIQFWNDDGTGAPDTTAPVCTYNATIVPVNDGAWGGWTAWMYSTDLTPPCVLPNGWVSVQGTSAGDSCWFMWINSAYVDGAYQNTAPTTYDVGFCLTGQFEERWGACCDMNTGNCVDNVPEINCLQPNQRFVADTLCANLDPPCEPPPWGACCIDGICVADFIEVECTASGGSWWEGESCFASPPYECPGPPGCPPDEPPGYLLFAQNVSGPTEWATAYTCTSLYNYYAYENFAVSGPICDIHFFGLELEWQGTAWAGCDDPDITFDIIFYPDVGGMPDLVNPACSYQDVPPTVRTTHTDALYNGNPLHGYEFNLSPCCVLYSGWVSVYDTNGNTCVFLWMDSPEGDNFFWRDTTGTLVPVDPPNNVNLCLTGEAGEVFGACCDDATGICNDNVEMAQCPAPLRFMANTLCADLAPPCGQAVGACCIGNDSTDCVVVPSAECDTLGGMWLGVGSQCTQCPCVLACLPGMTLEGEPICSDGYIDNYNAGCNNVPEVFQQITPCDTVICGTTGVYDANTSRDTDWYEVTVEGPGTLYWAMIPGWTAPPNGLIFILEPGPNGCIDLIQHSSTTGSGCNLMALAHDVPAGVHTYWLWAGPDSWVSLPCGSIYYAWAEFECAEGACCFEDDSCFMLTWGECMVNGGEWDGSPSCTPNPCGDVNYGNSDCSIDGAVNSYDIDYFIAAVSGEQAWIDRHGGAPTCDYLGANDMNCDGACNSYDIDRFIEAVSAGVPLPCPP